jgi:uncharacterized protein
MRLDGRRESGNVEDRRGMGGGGRLLGGGIGAGVIGLLIYLFTGDSSFMNGSGTMEGGFESQQTAPVDPANDEGGRFVKRILASTEDVWATRFRTELGQEYQAPGLILFSRAVQSGCGQATSASGPFYCPLDGKAYIDLSFYDELSNRFGAPGDFAMAYVIAHEIGHHIQNILGISDKVQRARQRVSEVEGNALSVRLELQADYLAGVWAHHEQQMFGSLESGDIEEALNAANAIGDDRLQKQSQGYVVPDAFTHGSSQQRMYWFKRGFERGTIADGDTFSEEL